MAEYSSGHITLAAEHDLGAAQDQLDALTADPESSPDQVTAAETWLAEAQAAHAGACADAAAARQADAGDYEAGS